MRKISAQAAIAVGLSFQVAVMPAASPVIGVATSNGNIKVDHATVDGSATLFDGNLVETGASSSRLQLKTGDTIQLGKDSRGSVFKDHLVLENGFTQTSGIPVEASNLRVAGGPARVLLSGKTVEVASLGAPLTVATATGVRLANLLPNTSLAFAPLPQDAVAGGLAPATLTGCVRKVGDAYLLTDSTSNVVVQLTGGGIEQHARHSIRVTGNPVTGSTPAAGAAQVIAVSKIEMQSAKCQAAAGTTESSSNGFKITTGIIMAGSIAAIALIVAYEGESKQPTSISPGRAQ